MTPDIRQLTREGKKAVMELLRATPEFTPEEILVAEEVIDSYLSDPVGSGYLVFASLAKGSVTGYICYGPTPLTQGTWDIYWMAVRTGVRGHGIGSALLRFAEDEIARKGGRLALVETSSKESYQKTRSFYYALGYSLACKVPDFYAPGDDKLILQKRISPPADRH